MTSALQKQTPSNSPCGWLLQTQQGCRYSINETLHIESCNDRPTNLAAQTCRQWRCVEVALLCCQGGVEGLEWVGGTGPTTTFRSSGFYVDVGWRVARFWKKAGDVREQA